MLRQTQEKDPRFILQEIEKKPLSERFGYALSQLQNILNSISISEVAKLLPAYKRLEFLKHPVLQFEEKSHYSSLVSFIIASACLSEIEFPDFIKSVLSKIPDARIFQSILRALPAPDRFSLAKSHGSTLIQNGFDLALIIEATPIEERLNLATLFANKIENAFQLSYILPLLQEQEKLAFSQQANLIRNEFDFYRIFTLLPNKDKFTYLESCNIHSFIEDTVKDIMSALSQDDIEKLFSTPELMKRLQLTNFIPTLLPRLSFDTTVNFASHQINRFTTDERIKNKTLSTARALMILHFGEIIDDKDSLETCQTKIDTYSRNALVSIQASDLYPPLITSLIAKYTPLYQMPAVAEHKNEKNKLGDHQCNHRPSMTG